MKSDPNCVKCPFSDRLCMTKDGRHPDTCPTVSQRDMLGQASEIYQSDPALFKFAAEASLQETACYGKAPNAPDKIAPVKPRVLETIEFCKRMGYHRVGLAFCIGLHREAGILVKMMEAAGLDVVSVMCKVGGIEKEYLGFGEEGKNHPGTFETMCNPVAQALILNKAKTQFNLVFGLCVGHDSLFLKQSDALCTVVVVKDRVLGHNPIGALYTAHTYYKHLTGDQ